MRLPRPDKLLSSAFVAVTICLSGSGHSQSQQMGETVSPDGMVTWPRAGEYTTALFNLPDGSQTCVVLLKPRSITPEVSYDISIWRQHDSAHLWLSLRGKRLPAADSIDLGDEGHSMHFRVSKRAQPAPSVDAVRADVSNQVFDEEIRPLLESGHDLTVGFGSTKYPLPTAGLATATRQLQACLNRLPTVNGNGP